VTHPRAAELSSILTDLESLRERVVRIADVHRGDADDPLTPQLDELERNLTAAARRLERTLRRLDH
jgi:hypothetical protein